MIFTVVSFNHDYSIAYSVTLCQYYLYKLWINRAKYGIYIDMKKELTPVSEVIQSRPKPKTGSRKKEQVRTVKGTYSTRLTKKQKAFADILLSNDKISATEAAAETYNVTERTVAGVIAAENLKKPNILQYMNKHLDKAQDVIIGFMDLKDDNNIGNKRLAYDSATQIIDRIAGKPTQIQQSQSVSFVQHLNSKQIDI